MKRDYNGGNFFLQVRLDIIEILENTEDIMDIFRIRGTLLVFLIIELSYIRVLKGMKLLVGAKIRIDYKRVFLISGFLISGIHCIAY